MKPKGLTLVEVLIAIVVSSVVVAAMFFSYNTFQTSYRGIMDRVNISQNARSSLSMIVSDARMAGFKDFNSSNTTISQPVELTDNQNSPDEIKFIYDADKTTRVRISYKLDKTDPSDTYYFLAKQREVWVSNNWTKNSSNGGYEYEKVADYILDMQFILRNSANLKINSSQSNKANNVETFIVVRSPNKISKWNQSTPIVSDNSSITCANNYVCEDFFVSVYPRNIMKN